MTNSTQFASDRVLVVAFEGWNDAGEAATGVVRTLKEQLELELIAEIDPEDYFDYQFNRPSIAQDDDGNRALVWPSVQMFGPTTPAAAPESIASDADMSVTGANEANVYLLMGTEPSRGWKTFTAEILETIRAHDITGVVFLGAMLADVPHTRPISLFVSSESAAVRTQLGIERSTYEGPVGILSVLAEAAEKAGIPTVSIWASVPHYVHNAPSPKATLAIIDKLEEVIDVVIPRGDLLEESTAWESGIDVLASEDDDMSTYIQQLEQARDTVDSPSASGEAIAQEFEKYLRREDGKPDGGKAGGNGGGGDR